MEVEGNVFLYENSDLQDSFYILHGENTFLIDKTLAHIEDLLKRKGYSDFSIKSFNAENISMQKLIDAANTLPFLGGKQFFFVKNLEENKTFITKEINSKLETFFKAKHPITTIFFISKGTNVDKRSKIFKIIEKSGTVINCNNPTEKELSNTIKDYVAQHNCSITTNGIFCVKAMTGNDMRLIYTELDKIFLDSKIKKIDETIIEKYFSDNRKYNFFQIQESIIDRDYNLTFRIMESILLQEKAAGLILTLSILHNFFSKILIIHQMKNKPNTEISEAIEVPSYFLDKYKTAANNFDIKKIMAIMTKILEIDFAIKGIFATNLSYDDLGYELIMFISSDINLYNE